MVLPKYMQDVYWINEINKVILNKPKSMPKGFITITPIIYEYVKDYFDNDYYEGYKIIVNVNLKKNNIILTEENLTL